MREDLDCICRLSVRQGGTLPASQHAPLAVSIDLQAHTTLAERMRFTRATTNTLNGTQINCECQHARPFCLAKKAHTEIVFPERIVARDAAMPSPSPHVTFCTSVTAHRDAATHEHALSPSLSWARR